MDNKIPGDMHKLLENEFIPLINLIEVKELVEIQQWDKGCTRTALEQGQHLFYTVIKTVKNYCWKAASCRFRITLLQGNRHYYCGYFKHFTFSSDGRKEQRD